MLKNFTNEKKIQERRAWARWTPSCGHICKIHCWYICHHTGTLSYHQDYIDYAMELADL